MSVAVEPSTSTHYEVNLVATGTPNACVRVLLLKYRELPAERQDFLINLALLLLRGVCWELVLAVGVNRLLLNVANTSS